MKTIIINASPRKNWNTAKLLKEAQKGAESIGATTEYINLYDIVCTGCRSCMACKRKGIAISCKCYWKDELTPIIDRIYHADRLIIGSPIYYNQTTSQFHALMERVCFPAMSYNDYSSNFNGKVEVDVFLTMNVDSNYWNEHYEEKFISEFHPFRYLNGNIRIHPCFDTLQVENYERYEMKAWNEIHKRYVHETQFPLDLKAAFNVGAKIYNKDTKLEV